MQIAFGVIQPRNVVNVELSRDQTKEFAFCDALGQRSDKIIILPSPTIYAPWIVDLIYHFAVDALFMYMYHAVATCATVTI